MIITKQIKRIGSGSYKILRTNSSVLGYITKLNKYWEVKLDGAGNCGVKQLHGSFDECQRALVSSGICSPK